MEISIDDVRKKYPDYSDLSDEQLVTGLHSKFYSDIPFEEFTAKIKGRTPPAPVEEPSMVSRMVGPGSPLYSVVKGAVIDPALAINQLLGNTGIFGSDVRQGTNQLVQDENKAYQAGRASQGKDGIDALAFIGAIVSPLNKLIPNANAANVLGRIGQQAVSGAALSGVSIPVLDEDFWSEKNFQLGLGGALSGAIPGAAYLSKGLGSFISGLPITKSAKEASLFKYLSNLTGENKQNVINELRSQGDIVSGSRPTVADSLGGTTFGGNLAREQSRVAKSEQNSAKFTERFQEQAEARLDDLKDTFGTKLDIEAAKQARLRTTAPMRERALVSANIYGETGSLLEAKLNAGLGQAPIRKVPTTLGGGGTKTIPLGEAEKEIIKGQIKSIKSQGYYPLTIDSLVKKIDTSLRTPGEKSNEMLSSTLLKVRGKLVRHSNSNGIINSADLYNIRKETADDISEFITTKSNTNTSFGAQAAKVEGDLKKLIDIEINKASGSQLWSEYLTSFAKQSKKIDQLEVGTNLQNKLGVSFGDVEKAGMFVNAVNESTSLIKRATGNPRYSKLEDLLTVDQMSAVNRVKMDLNRQAKGDALGKTVESTKGPSGEDTQVRGLLIRALSLTNTVIDRLRRGSQSEFDAKISELMLDPTKMADFLEVIPKGQTAKLAEAMMAKMSPSMRDGFKATLNKAPTSQQIMRGVATESVPNLEN